MLYVKMPGVRIKKKDRNNLKTSWRQEDARNFTRRKYFEVK